MEVCVEPTLSIRTNSEVVCVEFSPYEWSKSLLAVAFPNAISLYSLKLKEESENGKTELSLLCESHLEGEVCAMAWSPQTSLHASPPLLKLLLATTDDSVIEFTTDLKTTNVKEVFQHSSSINSVAYSGLCSSSSQLPSLCASVGDDQLLRVWQEDSDEDSTNDDGGDGAGGWSDSIMLMEPGQTVRFHPENPSLLLVCEISGTLRLYRISQSQDDSGQPMLTADWSVRCPAPMLDADWSLCDPNLLVAACPAGVYIINVDNNGSARKRLRTVGSSGSSSVVTVRAARSTAALVAAVTADNTLSVMHLTANRIPLVAHLKAVSGISWHLEQPYLAVGSDRRLLLWRVDHV
uniref:Nucleoporin Nup37-like n=1 Tax=Hirondellea gigas TaxID=1518452 RepID=A0A2P2I291_9CRUS